MRYVFDTNVWLRYLLDDIDSQHEIVKKLLDKVESGELKIAISTVSIMEIVYFLQKKTDLTKNEILNLVGKILDTRNQLVVETGDTKQGMEWFGKYKIKFQDCLIASSLKKNDVLVTWDSEFECLKKEVNIITPEELLAMRS